MELGARFSNTHILNHMCFNKFLTMFFKFSAEIIHVNVVHQKTQSQKSSQSDIVLIVNF